MGSQPGSPRRPRRGSGVRLFRRQLSRAEAIAKAIDMSDPGDTVEIHSEECFPLTMCICEPTIVYVSSDEPKYPLGFRQR